MSESPDARDNDQNLIEAPEPWAAWETWLCVASVMLGLVGLVVLGVVIELVF